MGVSRLPVPFLQLQVLLIPVCAPEYKPQSLLHIIGPVEFRVALAYAFQGLHYFVEALPHAFLRLDFGKKDVHPRGIRILYYMVPDGK